MIDEDYESKIKVVFEKKYELDAVEIKPVDINSEPFTVYLCGADLSSGQDITSTGRGDVYMYTRTSAAGTSISYPLA